MAGKRKQTQSGSYQAYQASLKRVKKAAAPHPAYRKPSGFAAQAMRTGGWANPQSSETKFIDNTFLLSPNFNSTLFTAGRLLNGCVQGTEATNRIGRKIVMSSLYLKGTFNLGTTSTGGGTARIIVVYDKQANGTAPAITDVLLSDDVLSPNNLSNRDRFTKICDFETETISVNGINSVSVETYRRLNLETMYNTGNAGTIGDITSGSLYMFVAQSGFIYTANPNGRWQVRIKFADP